MLHRLLKEDRAISLHAVELEEDVSRLGHGHEGDDDGLDLLGALARLEGVEVSLGRSGAGPSAATGHGAHLPFDDSALRPFAKVRAERAQDKRTWMGE